jgi:hypothetical protein
MKETQISAVVSDTTKELLERHVRETGVKKGHVVEMALRHHLRALQQLPSDIIVHPRIVISRRSGEQVLRRLNKPKRPTKELRRLIAPNGD